jgi:hypothetical protein
MSCYLTRRILHSTSGRQKRLYYVSSAWVMVSGSPAKILCRGACAYWSRLRRDGLREWVKLCRGGALGSRWGWRTRKMWMWRWKSQLGYGQLSVDKYEYCRWRVLRINSRKYDATAGGRYTFAAGRYVFAVSSRASDVNCSSVAVRFHWLVETWRCCAGSRQELLKFGTGRRGLTRWRAQMDLDRRQMQQMCDAFWRAWHIPKCISYT